MTLAFCGQFRTRRACDQPERSHSGDFLGCAGRAVLGWPSAKGIWPNLGLCMGEEWMICCGAWSGLAAGNKYEQPVSRCPGLDIVEPRPTGAG